MTHLDRLALATQIVENAAGVALEHFKNLDTLLIESKGFQDPVSEADKAVEQKIRLALAEQFPDDGIVGEEFDDLVGTSGFSWVIDPIDGTANYVSGIPCWCIVLACVFQDDQGGDTVVGVVHEPNTRETWTAARGEGAWLNGKPISVSNAGELNEGSVAVGYSNRVPSQYTINLLEALIKEQGIFFRNASGALMLAYVASGRLLGYCEPHMNAWDCLASILMIEEAGGKCCAFSMQEMLESGGKVIAGPAQLQGKLEAMCKAAFQ